jgi:hypothetical protein
MGAGESMKVVTIVAFMLLVGLPCAEPLSVDT